jgi:hypothetical protein|tara:strand:- start:35 stop:421 length:387 start_codon:yes stop_codon:yes gene_type:complete
MDDETITDALGLEPVKHESVSVIIPEKTDNDIENDFKYTRENLYSVIEQGNHALEQMIDVARASEHPRAYEVVSTLMNTLVNANKDLLDLSKKKQELVPKEDFGGPQTVNNNLFVGSTADLQKALKEL